MIWLDDFLPLRCDKATVPDASCDSALFKFDKATNQLKCFVIPTEPGKIQNDKRSITWQEFWPKQAKQSIDGQGQFYK